MKVLSSGKYDHVISWIPDGKAFVIHNQDELVEKVLPLFDFKGVKYSSFTRKVCCFEHVIRYWQSPFQYHSVLFIVLV